MEGLQVILEGSRTHMSFCLVFWKK